MGDDGRGCRHTQHRSHSYKDNDQKTVLASASGRKARAVDD